MLVECEYRQLNKYGEELCGDNVEIVRNSDNSVIVLSDGLGSGVKANILSTMTIKIASTMLSNGMDIEEVVETLVNTLPVCQLRQLAYSTFTIVQIFDNQEVKLVEFDNPKAFFVHEDRLTHYESADIFIADKNIKISRFKMSENDFLILVSDGLIHAGLGGLINLGWGWDKIGNFLHRNVNDDISTGIIADKLIFIANELYQGKIGDDTSVVVIKLRKKKEAVVAVGPPADKSKDNEFAHNFIQSANKKIICGGTTANIIAKELNKNIKVILEGNDLSVPPKAEIEGIDLVTEGIVTLSKAVEIVDRIKDSYIKKDNNTLQNIYELYGTKDTTKAVLEKASAKTKYEPKNPAEELALHLQDADKIKFIVGRAINPAHQNPDFPLQSGMKIKLINELKEKLEKSGKEVQVEYY